MRTMKGIASTRTLLEIIWQNFLGCASYLNKYAALEDSQAKSMMLSYLQDKVATEKRDNWLEENAAKF